MNYDFLKKHNLYMQTTLNHSMTIAEFQTHLERTQMLLTETKALSESERNDLKSHIDPAIVKKAI